jgi:hypothetical protein
MQLIAHQELTSAAASITFSSIPATFTDLVLVISGRTTGTNYSINATINGSTSNYTYRTLEGSGSTNTSFTQATGPERFIGSQSFSTNTASTFGSSSIYIPNYRSSVAKSISIDTVTENNATQAFQNIIAALWNETAAITEISLVPRFAANFAEYSSATLYGILAGSDGIVTVS